MNASQKKKFNAILARLADLRQCHGSAIEQGLFLHFSADFVKEAEWMAKRLQELTGVKYESKPAKKVELEEEDAELELVG